jgi:hypothetical protein
MSTRVDKPREYFSKLLDTPEEEIDYREIPPTTAADWQDAEVLFPVTENEFRAIEHFIWTHRSEDMMPSHVYNLFAEAIKNRKQIVCRYNGYYRELCPVILGHKDGKEKALTFQFGGDSEKGLPPGGQWRCLFLSRVRDVLLRDGPWHTGDSHTQPQGCVEIVDLDINPESPCKPKRRPMPLRAASAS